MNTLAELIADGIARLPAGRGLSVNLDQTVNDLLTEAQHLASMAIEARRRVPLDTRPSPTTNEVNPMQESPGYESEGNIGIGAGIGGKVMRNVPKAPLRPIEAIANELDSTVMAMSRLEEVVSTICEGVAPGEMPSEPPRVFTSVADALHKVPDELTTLQARIETLRNRLENALLSP